MNPEISKLMNAEGIGYYKAKRLIDEFGTYQEVKECSRAELQEVHGIGPILSWRIKPTPSLMPSTLTKEELK